MIESRSSDPVAETTGSTHTLSRPFVADPLQGLLSENARKPLVHHSKSPMSKLKDCLLLSAVGCVVAGAGCFAVLMHDVHQSLETNRPSLSSEQFSSLALAALLVPAVGVIPLKAAEKIEG
tara:strand:+ start:11 stop:373 length:363 start_codon:yes stop_codon:yes gene_type:complete